MPGKTVWQFYGGYKVPVTNPRNGLYKYHVTFVSEMVQTCLFSTRFLNTARKLDVTYEGNKKTEVLRKPETGSGPWNLINTGTEFWVFSVLPYRLKTENVGNI